MVLQIDVSTVDAFFGIVAGLELFQLAWMARLEMRLSRIEGYLKGQEVKNRWHKQV